MPPTVEIIAQPVELSEDEASERLMHQPVERLRSLVSSREIVANEFRYKPFYAFSVVLRKRVFMSDDEVTEGRIIVDGLTDISRPFTKETIEEEKTEVSPAMVINPTVDVEGALVTAKSRRMQIEHRERGEIEMDETPVMIYKPVWLFELATGDIRVVDATDGTVFSDLLLG
jgi:hypothetical protein